MSIPAEARPQARRVPRRVRPLLLVLCAAALVAAPVRAQQPAPGGATAPAVAGAEARRVADEAIRRLRSPYCPGLMLEVCPSEPAEALRDSIRDLAAQGYSAPQLVEWMIARHGEEWRAVPQRSGAGLWAWVAPPLFLLLGAGLVAAWLRRRAERHGPAPEPAADGAGLSDAERAEVVAAMRDMERDEERYG